MKRTAQIPATAVLACLLVSGCGGGGGGAGAPEQPPPAPSGLISLSLTDAPWEDLQALVLHVDGIALGHADGRVVQLDPAGGPMSVDMMQLQNGVFETLVEEASVPVGEYLWLRLRIDPSRSWIDLSSTGGRHEMQMGPGADNGLELHDRFRISEAAHRELMLDFDVRSGVQHHHMGAMGDQYQLHSAMRLVDMNDAGGIHGVIHPSLIDINFAGCDAAPGGNRAYLFPGDATVPDDIAVDDTDEVPGPMATDRVEMDVASGNFVYRFAYVTPGVYRVAFSCSGEWDEAEDDDYPADPDGHFDFLVFSDAVEVVPGQMHTFDIVP